MSDVVRDRTDHALTPPTSSPSVAAGARRGDGRGADLFEDLSEFPSLTTFSGGPVFARAAWTTDLAHRLRALLHATPLTDLRGSDEHHDISTRHYDSLTLAIRLLDAVVESTGLEDELDHEGARYVLDPLLRAMDRAAGVAPDVDRHEAVVRRLLAALLNDRNGREPFDVTYFDAGDGDALVVRHVTFRLLSDYHVGAGRIVLRLSNEAINLVLNALNLDLADAQAAAEAVVDSQLRRGRFEDALRSAQNARIRSVNYSRSIDEQIERTQRDVRRVDWREMMPRILEDARIHIELRLRTEDSILEAGQEKLDELPPGSAQAGQVAQIVTLMRDCRRRHMELHGRLMRARSIFLDAQGRQVFAAARAFVRPDLAVQVLTPVLRMTARDATVLAEAAFRLSHPPVPPGVFGLTDLLHYLMRPKRELGPGSVALTERDLVGYGSDPTFFSPEVRAAAHAVLAATPSGTILSTVLEATTRTTATHGPAAEGLAAEPGAVADLIAMIVLRAFAPDRSDTADGEDAATETTYVLSADPLLDLMAEFRIEVVPGSVLRVAGYIGDDLRLVRRTATVSGGERDDET